MTRINTNVVSLNAQKILARSNEQLQEALTRLSTGLRINTGKDDPAGLIASEVLRSDIVSVEAAIQNSETANQVIATADSALGQVSSLLNDIRGLVSEAANTGAMSTEQIAANQLQIDSSLEAIDRIAQVTQFQGKRLLDGSLDFITEGVDSSKLTGLQIDQANFGTQTEIDISVEVAAAAERAELNYKFSSITESTVLEIGGTNGFEAFSFAANSTVEEMAAAINLVSDSLGVRAEVATGATKGSVTVSSPGLNNGVTLTAKNAGFDPGDLRVKFTAGGTGGTTVNYDPANDWGDPGTIDIQLETTAAVAATGEVDDDDLMTAATLSYNAGGANNALTFTAKQEGNVGNGYKVLIQAGAGGAGQETVAFNEATGTLVVTAHANSKANQIIQAINSDAVASRFITAALSDAEANDGSGTGLIMAAGAQSLTGGTGDVNNDLQITSKLTGDKFNGANVHIVDGNATAAGIQSVARKATYSFTQNAANVTFTAKKDDGSGRDVKIVFTSADLGANGETVSVSGNTITINLDTDAGNGGANATTANDLVTLIENNANASALVSIAASGTTTNDISALATNAGGASLSNGHYASATETFGNSKVTYVAKQQGPAGNAVEIVFDAQDRGGAYAAAATVDGNTITINVDTDAANGGASASTVAELVTAIKGNAAASALIDIFASDSDYATTPFADSVAAASDQTLATTLHGEVVEYADEAKAARASVTFSGAGSNNDIIIQAVNPGDEYNDVSIVFNKAAGVSTTAPTVAYSEGSSGKVLTVTISTAGNTNISDIKAAIDAYEYNGEKIFTAAYDDSAGDGDGTGTVNHAAITNGVELGNTQNTGAAAGTLFIYAEEGVSTANAVMNQLASVKADGLEQNDLTARAAQLVTIASAGNSDGTGTLWALSRNDVLSGGQDGGVVSATAQDVIDAINANTALSAMVSASLGGSDDGTGTVGTFQEYAMYGSAIGGNRLQFLGKSGSPDVEFKVGAAGTALSIEDNRGLASLVKDSTAANTALVFTAKQKGSDFDGVRVAYIDDNNVTKGHEIVTYDEASKTLTFRIASGNAAGSNTTSDNIKAALAADDIAGNLFTAQDFGTSDGTGEVDADLRQASYTLSMNTAADKVKITANAYGSAGNAFTVTVADAGAGGASSISLNSSTGLLTVSVDAAATDAKELVELINNAVGGQFTATLEQFNNGGALTGDLVTAQAFTGGVGTDSNANGMPDASASDVVTTGGKGEKLIVNLAVDSEGRVTTTANDLVNYFDSAAAATLVNDFGVSVSNAEGSTGTGKLAATTSDLTFSTYGTTLVEGQATGTSVAVNGVNARVKVTAVQNGAAFDGVTLQLVNDTSVTKGNEVASYDGASKVLTVKIDLGDSTADDVIAAINGDLGEVFTAATATGGDGSGVVTVDDTLTLSGGETVGGSATGAAFLGNSDGAATGMNIVSNEFGSAAFVSVKTLSGSFEMTNKAGQRADRTSGVDLSARVNGFQAVGKGLSGTINTSALDLTFSLDATVAAGQKVTFKVTGGGAQFQLGPEVVSNQQARLGIQSVSTAKLGGVSGRLFELRSGGSKDLATDVKAAASVVEEVITQVTTLRGRLGAFQRTTLATNIAALNDTLEALTEAESSIRDADFAVESAKLTRAQILVQSGTSVLSIANQNPQNVLSLLR